MGAQGTATLDFGTFPGKSDASIAVTGQAGIVSGSLVEAWIRPVDTADHSADEHMLETLKVFAHNIIAGTGFTISGFNTSQMHEPLSDAGINRNHRAGGSLGQNTGYGANTHTSSVGGMGTRIYGQWSLAWVWN
jgi:hypothetical protein